MNDHTAEKDAHLRAVAEAADKGGRPWEWCGGYPQQVVRIGDAMLVAETYEGPDFPSTIAEFIATFDPPTVLALLDALRAARRTARDAVAAKEAGVTPPVTKWPDTSDGEVSSTSDTHATSVTPPAEGRP